MKLRRVDPKSIRVPEVRVSARFDPELYQQFQESIRAIGQITPPICYEVEGELVLCDGLHRLEEAIAGAETSVAVAVIPGDMVDVLTKNLMLDHLRGKHAVADMVKVIGALETDFGLDSDKIKERTGLGRDYIERLIKISQASPTVLQALDDGIIGVGHAFEVARLPHAIQQDEVVAKLAVFKFTVAQLHEQVDMVLGEMDKMKHAPPPAGDREERPPPRYICEGCKGEVDPRYLRPVILCPECFGGVWRLSKTAELAAAAAGGDGRGA